MNLFFVNFKIFRNYFGLTQEQLAKTLSLEYRTIVAYETGKRIPPLNTLFQIAQFYGFSLDYLIAYENCSYPRSLKMLKLAKMLDNKAYSEARNNVEGMINTLWSKKINTDTIYKQDNPSIELTSSFHKNLKELRNIRKMTQTQVAETIKVSRSLLNQYETRTFPPIDILIELANIFNLSNHSMNSGEKLFFDFDDKFFGKTILSADQQLTIEEKKTLINLLEATINNKT